MKRPVVYPLTIYVDGSCPLCASEMGALKACDRNGRLLLLDCSVPGFADEPLEQAGLTQADLMRFIHARDAGGQWLRGVAVFEQAYRAVGLKLLAFVWGCRLWRPLLERTYPSIARHRQALSRLGVPAGLRRVIGALGGRSACAGKTCELR